MYPSIFNSFSLIRTASSKNRHPAHIFVSPGDAPTIITQYVAWMERKFNGCQFSRSMYLSIFNSFRVIRCLSQCVSPKIAILPHFCFPWGRPWVITLNLYGWKENSMLTNCLAASADLTITVSGIQRDICEKNRHFIIPPCIRRPC